MAGGEETAAEMASKKALALLLVLLLVLLLLALLLVVLLWRWLMLPKGAAAAKAPLVGTLGMPPPAAPILGGAGAVSAMGVKLGANGLEMGAWPWNMEALGVQGDSLPFLLLLVEGVVACIAPSTIGGTACWVLGSCRIQYAAACLSIY